MTKNFCMAIFHLVAALTVVSPAAFADGGKTNSPAKVSVKELLSNKDRWNSNRVDVSGYYLYFFEHSVLTSSKGEPSREGIWIDTFQIAPIGKGRISQVSNGPVRIIGTFKFYKNRGAGHLNQCPAEITNLELLEEPKEQQQKATPGTR